MKRLLFFLPIIVFFTAQAQTGPVIGQEFVRPGATQIGVDFRKKILDFGILGNFSFLKKDLDQKWLKYYPSLKLTGSYYGTIYGGVIVGKKPEFIINLMAGYGMRKFPANADQMDRFGNSYGSYGFGTEGFAVGGIRAGLLFPLGKSVKIALLYIPDVEYYLRDYNKNSNGRNPWSRSNFRQQAAINLFFKPKK